MSAPYGEIVSRARLKPDASSAGRIATSRRADRGPARAERQPAREPAKKPAKSAGKKGGKGKKVAVSPFLRLCKLVMLITFMAMLGFGIVLVVDVGLTLMGGIHLGSITFAELIDKVEARVFDRDLPEPMKKKPAPAAKPKPKAKRSPVVSSSSSSAPAAVAELPETERAELPAPAPADYAKDVEPREDVEVVEARARLDRLLKGL